MWNNPNSQLSSISLIETAQLPNCRLTGNCRQFPRWCTSFHNLQHVVEVLVSILGRCQREFPLAIENFSARAKEAHRVIPPLHDREAIGNFAIAAAKLDGDRTIRTFDRCVAIDGIGTVLVRFNITLTVVDGERPETVDGHASHDQLVNGRSVIPLRRDGEIERVLLGSATPKHRTSDYVPYRINLILVGTVHPSRI